MSAARLAAEAAFDLPRQAVPAAGEPLIVVRKARIIAPATQPAMAQASAAPEPDAAHKSPRVFRIDATGPRTEGADAAPAGDDTPAASPPSPVRRRRRLDDGKRPGPLLQLYQAAPRQETDAGAQAGSRAGLLEGLVRQLAGLDPLFDDIRHAQALRFQEDSADPAWQGLALEIDGVQALIQSQMGAEPIPAIVPVAAAVPAEALGPSAASVFKRRG